MNLSCRYSNKSSRFEFYGKLRPSKRRQVSLHEFLAGLPGNAYCSRALPSKFQSRVCYINFWAISLLPDYMFWSVSCNFKCINQFLDNVVASRLYFWSVSCGIMQFLGREERSPLSLNNQTQTGGVPRLEVPIIRGSKFWKIYHVKSYCLIPTYFITQKVYLY